MAHPGVRGADDVNAVLVRHAYMQDSTLGRLYAGDLVLRTLEEPWLPDPDGRGGQRRVNGLRESCVPDGVYTLRPHSGRIRDVWALENHDLGVYYQPGDIPAGQRWGRSAILIHGGTTLEQTLGCILVPPQHLDALRAVLGRHVHTLTIRPTAGTLEH
jgi:hypothetical protein